MKSAIAFKLLREMDSVKKVFLTLLAVTMMISVYSGVCFASQGEAGNDMLKKTDDIGVPSPVVCDRAYPEQGFRTHSWVTQEGGKAIAHTQVMDQATGSVLKQVDEPCSYTSEN